jgi:hypothetical protein
MLLYKSGPRAENVLTTTHLLRAEVRQPLLLQQLLLWSVQHIFVVLCNCQSQQPEVSGFPTAAGDDVVLPGAAMIGGVVLLKLESFAGLFSTAAGGDGGAGGVDWSAVLAAALAPHGRQQVSPGSDRQLPAEGCYEEYGRRLKSCWCSVSVHSGGSFSPASHYCS